MVERKEDVMKRALTMAVAVVVAVVLLAASTAVAQDKGRGVIVFTGETLPWYWQNDPNVVWVPRGDTRMAVTHWGLRPSENIRIDLHEKWDRHSGERRFRQEPDLEAKKIDAMTTLGTALILGTTLVLIGR